MIIDSHTHLSVMEKEDGFDVAAEKFHQYMSQNKIDGAIVIADNVSNDECADTNRIQKFFKNEKNIWLVGSTSPFEPSDRTNSFVGLVENREVIAMKLFPGHDKIYLDDPRYLPDIELCNKYNIPLMIHTGINTGDNDAAQYNDPKFIADIARANPLLKIVLCHFFWPKLEYCFETTTGLNNIYFDTSALADDEVIEASGGLEIIKNILEKTLKRRPGSVLFGTDFPMCPVAENIKLIQSLEISDLEKEAIFSRTAIEVFQLLK